MDSTALKPSTRDEMKILLFELRGGGLLDSLEEFSPTSFSTALELPRFLSKEDEELTLGLVVGLERIIRARIKHQLPFFKICMLLKEVFQCTDEEISRRIGQATQATLTYSRSWISKNIKAGKFLSEFRQFAGVNDVERLCMLSRIPKGTMLMLTHDGKINGTDLKTAPRQEIQSLIDHSRADETGSQEELLIRELTELAHSMRKLRSTLPEEDERFSNLRQVIFQLSEEIRFGAQRPGFQMRKLELLTRAVEEGRAMAEKEASQAA